MRELSKYFKKLSTKDKEYLKAELENLIFQDKNTFQEKSKEYHRNTCPHCNSEKYVKNGINQNGIQTYCCKKCGKFFCDTTGQSIHRIHYKDKWFQYIELLFNGNFNSTRYNAELLEVNHKTIFRWRHKILTAIQLHANSFNGIVELDDLHYNFSQKGRKGIEKPHKRGRTGKKAGDNDLSVKVIAAMDRVDTLKLDVVRIGRLKANDLKHTGIQDILNSQTNIITSDKHPSIKSFTKSEHIRHEAFLAKQHSRNKLWHVNTVNERANRLKQTINVKFKGVATKYLQNYANWFKLIELKKYMKLDFFDKSFHNTDAWFTYHKRETNYEIFLTYFSNIEYSNPVIWG